MLAVPAAMLTIPWVMAAQALSGIAKDLNKMSAKSSIKLLVPNSQADSQQTLYRWVARLTGSKNALNVGFFMGAALLSVMGFTGGHGNGSRISCCLVIEHFYADTRPRQSQKQA